MHRRAGIPALALVLVGMTGCADDAPAPVDVAVQADAPAQAQAPPAIVGEAGWNGIGGAIFGMNSQEVLQAWDGRLERGAGGTTCYQLVPTAAGDDVAVRLMIEDDKFVRYDVAGPATSAPGGGRVGMRAGALADLYPRMSSGPHEYVEGGRYLQVDGERDRVLVFETDAQGSVTAWRVGEMPQVAYGEGCG